jgi:hypothetical protein
LSQSGNHAAISVRPSKPGIASIRADINEESAVVRSASTAARPFENARESPFLANESVSAGLIFDLPNIACGMLFSVNMWADEFSAPNLVKAVPALPMHSPMTRLPAPSWMRPSAGTPLIDAIVCDPTGQKRPGG